MDVILQCVGVGRGWRGKGKAMEGGGVLFWKIRAWQVDFFWPKYPLFISMRLGMKTR